MKYKKCKVTSMFCRTAWARALRITRKPYLLNLLTSLSPSPNVGCKGWFIIIIREFILSERRHWFLRNSVYLDLRTEGIKGKSTKTYRFTFYNQMKKSLGKRGTYFKVITFIYNHSTRVSHLSQSCGLYFFHRVKNFPRGTNKC